MALVECGLCSWLWEVEESLPEDQILAECAEVFARHMWEKHRDEARTDPIAIAYIRSIAAHQARTS